MAAKPPAPGKAAGVKNGLTKKVGPLPVYGWALLAVGVYLGVKKFGGAATSTATGTATPTASGSPGPSAGGGGGSDGGGGGNVSGDTLLAGLAAQNANLTSGLLGAQQADVQINSNLVTGLLGAFGAVQGLGETALNQSGYLEQAVVNSYFPTAPAVSGGTSSSGAVNSAQMTVTPDVGYPATNMPALDFSTMHGPSAPTVVASHTLYTAR